MTRQQALKHPCGGCTHGWHELCPGAVFNPGSGEVITPGAGSTPTVYAGELRYCPCDDPRHTPRVIRCRCCGYRNPDTDTTDRGECVDRDACRVRSATSAVMRFLRECQTTRYEGGQAVQRARRSTPAERGEARAQRAASKARDCICGCGGVTKGGLFLPGHDSRLVSRWGADFEGADPDKQRDAVDRFAALGVSPALAAKLAKRLGVK